MMQVYVKGSTEAVQLYQKAFDAKLISEYKNDDGSYMHAELDVFGQILALSESREEKKITGNIMQFCLHFGKGNVDKIHKAYEVLKEDAKVQYPLGPVSYSPFMFGLVDKFGVSWCLFE
ncbi:PhnB protein [Alkaliphilus peptidifermentans DSM 18978]|uniref:PhnB protein n=2 Tax=Alkaliphilus TaxID=114627 RepID=A0A1G5GX32_9FIRM|nr:PhnB protein [Alkaliphilus peptidifermentans DSM 18978]